MSSGSSSGNGNKMSVRPQIVWGRPQSKEIVVRDNTWFRSFAFSAPDTSKINIKAGNKAYILSAETVVNDRLVTSEAALLKKYRWVIILNSTSN